MGAHPFTDYIATPDVEAAYQEAIDAAAGEYGHDPYNGSISTTDGYFILDAAPVTLTEASQTFRDRLDDPRISRRDECAAWAICDETGTRIGWFFFGLAAS
ncbi:hypothetical protein AB0F88_17235 [Streptosporangium sp. NPDC023963]|uniref:hypothetical protein n=1 Tax=Streptosporangium sp. NPDC023963 TaxID=3155608 RepID=UPI00343C3434